MLHSVEDAIVAHIPAGWRVNPDHAFFAFEWEGGFEATEILEFNERQIVAELCGFAQQAKQARDFIVRVPMSFVERMKRKFYYYRLARGSW